MTHRALTLLVFALVVGCSQPESGQESAATNASDAPVEASRGSVLTSGLWTGGLTPMNHPDQTTPLQFQVDHTETALSIVMQGPDGLNLNTRGARVEGDTLRFVFIEPESMVPLRCALGGASDTGYEGRCADREGKWALVTMTPPAG